MVQTVWIVQYRGVGGDIMIDGVYADEYAANRRWGVLRRTWRCVWVRSFNVKGV